MTPYDLILACLIFAASAHFISIAVLLVRPYVPPEPRCRPSARRSRSCARPAASRTTSRRRSPPPSRIDYPEFEIVFCVADETDPVIPLIGRLMAGAPERAVAAAHRRRSDQHQSEAQQSGEGLARGPPRLDRHGGLNVLIPPNYIDELLSRWTAEVGLVCSPPVGIRPEGVGAELECAFLNTYQARWQLTADAFGIGFAQGKTMLWRRDDPRPRRRHRGARLRTRRGRRLDQDRPQRRPPRPPRAQPLPAAARLPRRSPRSGSGSCAGRASAARPSRRSTPQRSSRAASCRLPPPPC